MAAYEQLEEYERNPHQNTDQEKFALELLAKPELPRIEEAEFLTRWIGLFWEREKYPEMAAAWVDRVALSPRHEVEIVKNGEVVAIVPAIIGPTVTDMQVEHRSTLGHASAAAIATGNNFPRLGETYLRSALQDYNSQLSNRPEVKAVRKEYTQAWRDLFTKYGLIQSVSEEETAKEGQPTNELNEDQFSDLGDDF